MTFLAVLSLTGSVQFQIPCEQVLSQTDFNSKKCSGRREIHREWGIFGVK